MCVKGGAALNPVDTNSKTPAFRPAVRRSPVRAVLPLAGPAGRRLTAMEEPPQASASPAPRGRRLARPPPVARGHPPPSPRHPRWPSEPPRPLGWEGDKEGARAAPLPLRFLSSFRGSGGFVKIPLALAERTMPWPAFLRRCQLQTGHPSGFWALRSMMVAATCQPGKDPWPGQGKHGWGPHTACPSTGAWFGLLGLPRWAQGFPYTAHPGHRDSGHFQIQVFIVLSRQHRPASGFTDF